jgi:hypothetical protein
MSRETTGPQEFLNKTKDQIAQKDDVHILGNIDTSVESTTLDGHHPVVSF